MFSTRITQIATLLAVSVAVQADAFNLLSPADPIIAIDLDFTFGSSSPAGEPASAILDGDSGTKYLNFGVLDTGFIVTPGATDALQGFQLTTANDAAVRDPATWRIWGTNDPITSTAHSNGREENWIEIAMGDVTLPDERFTPGDVVGFSNSTTYSSYKMTYPDVKDNANGCCMQVADVSFFNSPTGGTNFLQSTDAIIPIRDVDPFPSSNSPEAEGPENAIDGTVGMKYLNFGEERSGLIVTPDYGPAVINGIQVTTANDAPERDPASWEIYGTNDAIVTENNGIGDVENWTLVDSGTFNLPGDRLTPGAVIPVNNDGTAYSSYRVIFPTVRDAGTANSMQIAELSLLAPDEAVVEVNRQTGEVVIRALEAQTIGNYAFSSEVEGLNATDWSSIASTGADANDTWVETSDTPAQLAEEDGTDGANDGITIAAGSTYSLGSVWESLPASFEDLVVDIRRPDGSRVGAGIEFVGTELPIGDLSGNGSVGPEDWPLFRAGYGGTYAGMSRAAAYLGGDLDGDFDSDINDFNILVDAAGGAAALGIPEPSSVTMLGLLAGIGFCRRRRRALSRCATAVVAVGAVAMTNSADAQLTYSKVGNTPTTSIPADQMNEAEGSGPDNLFDDDFLDIDAQQINSELFALDYNDPEVTLPGGEAYLQYAGLGGDPKTVFFDYGSSVNANWFAYSQRSGADVTADRVGQFEFWFSNSDFGGTTPTTDPDAIVKIDPTDNRLRDSVLRPYPLGESKSGRYVAMRLTSSALSENQPVSNIGGHEFRLLSGQTTVLAEVNRATGEITLNNNQSGAGNINLNSIQIASPTASLDASGFNGLGGDTAAFPIGNGSGNGWEIGDGSDARRLVEGRFTGQSTLNSGTTGLSLGNAYNELTLAEDLSITWSNAAGEVYDFEVTYVGTAPTILPGDYNDDDVVDAADYTVWRDNLGTMATLPNDVTPGTVDESDYDRWTLHYGSTAAGSNAVPEPTSVVMLLAVAGLPLIGRRSR